MDLDDDFIRPTHEQLTLLLDQLEKSFSQNETGRAEAATLLIGLTADVIGNAHDIRYAANLLFNFGSTMLNTMPRHGTAQMPTETVGANQMAYAAGADPKTFRNKLRRDQHCRSWHSRYQSWDVPRGSPEHEDMLRVLATLPGRKCPPRN